MLEIKAVYDEPTNTTGYVLYFNDEIRTVVTEPLQHFGSRGRFTQVTGVLQLDTPYQICYTEDIQGSLRTQLDEYMTFAVRVDDDCRFIQGGKFLFTSYLKLLLCIFTAAAILF